MDWSLTYIVGGGPSVRGLDFDRLRNGVVLGVNEAAFYMPRIDAFFTGDHTWTISVGDSVERLPKACERHFCFRPQHHGMPQFKRHNATMWTRVFSKHPAEEPGKLSSGAHPKAGCTGIAAINLAKQKGAKLVLLFGYDFNPDGYCYWFNDAIYPRVLIPEVLSAFGEVADWYRVAGPRVINANPKSHVPGFERMTHDEAIATSEASHG